MHNATSDEELSGIFGVVYFHIAERVSLFIYIQSTFIFACTRRDYLHLKT